MALSTSAPTPSPPAAAQARTRAAADWARHAPFALFWLLTAAVLLLPIALFLLVALSPRLFDQGPRWFSLAGFQGAFQGPMLQGIGDTLLVGAVAAVASAAVGFGVAWVVQRTRVPGRRLWSGAMFALLLVPSYLIALGWERLLEPQGVLDLLHVPDGVGRSLLFGPVGVIGVLTVKGIPFAYLAISAGLRGLGEEFEAAVRVHGGGRAAVTKTVLALLAPAIWSSLAIVFAESISDFGVASTLANDAHFPVATFELYNAVDNFPVQFPVAPRRSAGCCSRWPDSRCSRRTPRCAAAVTGYSVAAPARPAAATCPAPRPRACSARWRCCCSAASACPRSAPSRPRWSAGSARSWAAPRSPSTTTAGH
jgi:iron(III) transport system permease protein